MPESARQLPTAAGWSRPRRRAGRQRLPRPVRIFGQPATTGSSGTGAGNAATAAATAAPTAAQTSATPRSAFPASTRCQIQPTEHFRLICSNVSLFKSAILFFFILKFWLGNYIILARCVYSWWLLAQGPVHKIFFFKEYNSISLSTFGVSTICQQLHTCLYI